MLGTAFRIAQRLGIPSESANVKHTVLEAEMRRRLWWSMVLFDARISEVSDHKATTLVPTWDCQIPLNVNDFDLHPDMKIRPANQEEPTEALFLVVRSELTNFVRHSSSHLDFINPILKVVATASPSRPCANEADGLQELRFPRFEALLPPRQLLELCGGDFLQGL